MAWLPNEAAVTFLEQRGFEHVASNYFAEPPKSKREALENAEFVAALLHKYAEHTERDAQKFVDYVGTPKPTSILDIGCGIALLDYYIYEKLGNEPMLYLLDGSPSVEVDEQDTLHYASGSYVEIYNEFTFRVEQTRKCLMKNGVKQERINFIAPSIEAIANLKRIDLVVSRASWGNHYPLSVYWEGVKACLGPDSVIILDIRDNERQAAFLREQFNVVEHVERHEHWSHWRLGCREPKWL